MAIVRWMLVAVMALTAAGSVLWYAGYSLSRGGGSSKAEAKIYYCPMHPQIVQDHPGECPICSMTLVPKPDGPVKPSASMEPAAEPAESADGGAALGKYHCPMHPHVTSDDPDAKCDLCGGMQLIPRPDPEPASAPGAEGTPADEPVPGLVPVDIPLDRIQKIGVRTAPVTRQALVNQLRTVGAVEASERGFAQITPRFSGWIEELLVSETGQKVARGQTLATIYSPEILQAQQELLTALDWSTGAAKPDQGPFAAPEELAGDARRRLELLGIAAQDLDAIVKNRKALRAIPIRSPVAGHVVGKQAVAGMSVSSGTALFDVVDLSTVWVVAEIFEADMSRIRTGQPARFEVTAYPGEIFTGKVQFIHPILDATSRTLRIRIVVRNRPGPGGLKLRPGLFGTVSLDLPGTSGLMVPVEAVVDTGDVRYVFVAKDGGRYEPRRVKLGARGDNTVEVVQGLREGEVVVTTANFLIDSESRLRAAIESP